MARQIAIKDDLYDRLSRIKGKRSFSEIIELLLDKSGYEQADLLQVLQDQNRALKEILKELKALNRRLSSLRFEAREVKEIKHVTAMTSREDDKLPSYLRGNPWVEILEKRCREV